jgi:hypothetical protein
VSPLAGYSPSTPSVESDAAGSVYIEFGGFDSNSRTSFRLDQNGTVSATFSHVDLVFPRGIDADADGNVYILNAAGVGVGNRLFKFDASGGYVADFPIPESPHPSEIAINERAGELYVANEFGDSVVVYDITSGTPMFDDVLTVPGHITDVFIEPVSGRIFGSYYDLETDAMGLFLRHTGFEVSRSGTLLQLFMEDGPPRDQTVRSVVAIAIPEPRSAVLAAGVGLSWSFRGRSRWGFT